MRRWNLPHRPSPPVASSTKSSCIVRSAESCELRRIRVLDHNDTAIRNTEEFGPDDTNITLTAKGRGGTRFAPVFERLSESDQSPAALLYFTDMENGSERIEQPAYPVLWVTGKHGTINPPFGQVVRIEGF